MPAPSRLFSSRVECPACPAWRRWRCGSRSDPHRGGHQLRGDRNPRPCVEGQDQPGHELAQPRPRTSWRRSCIYLERNTAGIRFTSVNCSRLPRRWTGGSSGGNGGSCAGSGASRPTFEITSVEEPTVGRSVPCKTPSGLLLITVTRSASSAGMRPRTVPRALHPAPPR